MNNRIHVFTSPEDTARAVAEIFLTKSKEKKKLSLSFNIAVSGGNTPKLLFQLLAKEYSSSIPWHIVRLFWVDERCVPPTHPESNFGMVYDSLLVNVPIQEKNIFRMHGENNPEKEAHYYATLLDKELTIVNDLPQFDLVLLGMGDDGHTASIFPDNMSLLSDDRTVATAVHPETLQKRITLTGNIISNASQLIFLITGSSKANILRQIIHQTPESKNYPATHFSKLAASSFYLDSVAANQINDTL